jgi:hypothetical protein
MPKKLREFWARWLISYGNPFISLTIDYIMLIIEKVRCYPNMVMDIDIIEN